MDKKSSEYQTLLDFSQRTFRWLKDNLKHPCIAKIPNTKKLQMYGTFMSGTRGVCKQRKPSFFKIRQRAMYKAWKLSDKLELSKTEYLTKYKRMWTKYFPDWDKIEPKL